MSRPEDAKNGKPNRRAARIRRSASASNPSGATCRGSGLFFDLNHENRAAMGTQNDPKSFPLGDAAELRRVQTNRMRRRRWAESGSRKDRRKRCSGLSPWPFAGDAANIRAARGRHGFAAADLKRSAVEEKIVLTDGEGVGEAAGSAKAEPAKPRAARRLPQRNSHDGGFCAPAVRDATKFRRQFVVRYFRLEKNFVGSMLTAAEMFQEPTPVK